MTEQLDALRSSVVEAVQQELTRYNVMVSTEIQRLRAEVAAERSARVRTEQQLLELAPAIEQAQGTNASFQAELQRAVESRLTEFANAAQRRQEDVDTRIGRVVDEANIGLVAAVESAARPVVAQLEHRQGVIETNLEALDRSVRKFDDQAGKMVQHFNVLTAATEQRLDEVTQQVGVQIDGRVGALATRLDEVSAQAARQQAEVANTVGKRVDEAESRINDRLLTSEARINESVGQRVADIDAYVGRVSAGLDDAVAMLSDRIAGTDTRFAEVNEGLADMGRRLESVDVDAIDEMKDRVSSAAGEVELVRIEVERFQESTDAAMDKSLMRIVELETQMQEQHLDVETAVQLERLEEVERALIALDPNQFVRRTDSDVPNAGHHNTQTEEPSFEMPSFEMTLDTSGTGNSAPTPEPEPAPFASPAPAAPAAPSAPSLADAAPPASAPFSAPTPFNPPVNASH